MKPCANPNCENAGKPLPDDAFSVDNSSPDGLNDTCLECNRKRSKGWQLANAEKKRKYARDYKAAVKAGAIKPKALAQSRPPRAEREQAQAIDTEPDDHQFIRFSAGEWLFVLAEAERLGLKPSDYVRNLVRDARRRAG